MVTGGIDIPSQLPTNLVSRSQEHIAVTINYRLNIFGSKYTIPAIQRTSPTDDSQDPIAKALNGTSFQLQDVRAAVEWVYENIEAFGGDPDNIFVRHTNPIARIKTDNVANSCGANPLELL